MSEREKLDHDPTGGLGREMIDERFEGAGIGPPRKELVAVDKPHERHRLALQRMDDVPVVAIGRERGARLAAN